MSPQSQVRIRANRREHPRTPFHGPVLVELPNISQPARGRDVSAGGMKLESSRPLPLGGEVDVYFELSGLAIESRARVVRQVGTEYCLQFDKESRHTIPASALAFDREAPPFVA